MKFKRLTRRGKLEASIKLKLLKNPPNIEEILKCVDVYEKDNLATIEKLKKGKIYDTNKINGALRQTINAHGPITKLLIGSASKRIYGSLIDNPIKTKETLIQRLLKWIRK